MNKVTVTVPGKSFDREGNHTGLGPWIDIIHAANRIDEGFFGSPSTLLNHDDEGRYVEVYSDANVILGTPDEQAKRDSEVTIVSTSEYGMRILAAAISDVYGKVEV